MQKLNKRNIMATTMEAIMDRIIDIHNHVLPGVDDGAQTIEDSLKIIKNLRNVGITDIVLTSHYIRGTKYEFNILVRQKILEELKKSLTIKDVTVYLGNEVYICEEIYDLYKNYEISSINNSKYMLVELPLSGYSNSFPNILCDMESKGLVPIIAHPERYKFLQKNPGRVSEILEFNALLQINVDSLIGRYGKAAKKTAKWLLKNNLVQFVATDVHNVNGCKHLKRAYKKLKKLVGQKKYEELTYTNAKKVLENREVAGNVDYMSRERSW